MMSHLAHFCIRLYHYFLSPLLGCNCRFTPSCSHYAAEAIEAHGALKGGVMAVKRLLRCHPWGKSGYDPVPTRYSPLITRH